MILHFKRKITKLLIGVFTIIITVGFHIQSPAIPPHPQTIEEFAKNEDSPLHLIKTIAAMKKRGIDAPSKIYPARKANLTGSFKALAILIEFPDKTGCTNPSEFDSLLFASNQGSVRHYYNEMSHGNLDIITVNAPSQSGWIMAPEPYTYYCDNQYGTGGYPQNSQGLCEDIIDLIDPVIDFSLYDNNGNGFVDALILIHTGSGAELTGDDEDIWSHKWAIPSAKICDGVKICEYTVQPEYWYRPGDMTCGVFCHELGHIFGLPDLYDRDGSSYGIGTWSLMSYGVWLGVNGMGSCPAGFDAWSRIQLGFDDYINVSSDIDNISMTGIINGGPIYRLWTRGEISNEYYLLENRQKTGYDTYLKGEGLLIWHIDESQSDPVGPINDNEWYPEYTSKGNYLVSLEQADGLYQLEKKLHSSGDPGDPFPGSSLNSSFTPNTMPNSNDFNTDTTYISITHISISQETVTSNFHVFPPDETESFENTAVPSIITLNQNYPNPFNPTTTISFNLTQGSHLSLTVYDILGRPIKKLLDDYSPAGYTEVIWNGLDENGEIAPSGVYFYRITTLFGSKSTKMILIK